MSIFKKKKEYVIGDFKTDDINDYGIAKYWYKQCTYLEDKNFKLWKENQKLIEENARLKKEINLHSRKLEITDLEVRKY